MTTGIIDSHAAEVVRDLAIRTATPYEVAEGIFTMVTTNGDTVVLDVRDKLEADRPQPNRAKGHVKLREVDSFTSWLAKHARDESELWANEDADEITAVVDAGDGAAPGWEQYRATLALRLTRDWREWNEVDRKLLPQQDFAEFVEQHLPNFVQPDSATMLELAQSIKGHSGVSWDSSRRLKDGQTQLTYHETINATAGSKGSIEIPDMLMLAMQVYEGGPAFSVPARFRFRVSGGSMVLGVVLERPRDRKLHAFKDVVQQVSKDADREVWLGKPAEPRA